MTENPILGIALVFPGQGSQGVGMMAELAEAYPVVGETFAEAADALGKDLWALSREGPAEALADTRVTQPLMFVADVATHRALVGAGLPAPTAVAGHSLGEFAALVAAGAIDFARALPLVAARARFMAEAVPEGEGGMAALIGLDDAAAIELCESLTGERVVEAVNFNAPGQVAISGHADAVGRAAERAKARGAKRALVLPVSVPNHSSLMRGAGQRLAAEIDALDWTMPALPVVQNASAAAPANLDALLASLRTHVHDPVRWTASVEALRDAHGATLVLECGPGKVLAGLLRRIDRSLECVAVDSPAALERAIETAGAAA